MQRGIKQTNGDRQPVHDREKIDKILTLEGQQLIQCGAAGFFVTGDNHLAHMNNPLGIEEHVFRAA